MKLIFIFIVMCFFALSIQAHAEMYRWEDKNGVVTFKDTPPPPSKKNKVKVYSDSDFTAPPPVPAPSKQRDNRPSNPVQASSPTEVKPVRSANPIEMYVTDWCGVCKRAEQFMVSKNYSFVAYDIEKDKAAMKRYRDLGGRGVPLIILGSRKLSGFSASDIDQYMQGH